MWHWCIIVLVLMISSVNLYNGDQLMVKGIEKDDKRQREAGARLFGVGAGGVFGGLLLAAMAALAQ
jgi:hypothetical protein